MLDHFELQFCPELTNAAKPPPAYPLHFLRPDVRLSHAACGHPVALAIIEAWRWPSMPVTVTPTAEFDQLLASQICLFTDHVGG